MLSRELEADLRVQGLKVKDFSRTRGTGGKTLARLQLKAERGDLDFDTRNIARQVISFHLPDAEISMSPVGFGTSKSVFFAWQT